MKKCLLTSLSEQIVKLLLYFADNLVSPCLWAGTALGNVFVVVLNLPVRDQRESQPVLTITTGNPVILRRGYRTQERQRFCFFSKVSCMFFHT